MPKVLEQHSGARCQMRPGPRDPPLPRTCKKGAEERLPGWLLWHSLKFITVGFLLHLPCVLATITFALGHLVKEFPRPVSTPLLNSGQASSCLCCVPPAVTDVGAALWGWHAITSSQASASRRMWPTGQAGGGQRVGRERQRLLR